MEQPEEKILVTVSFVIDATAADLGEGGDGWAKAIEYCSKMFTAVNYPNRIGDEWYVDSVLVDDGGDDGEG